MLLLCTKSLVNISLTKGIFFRVQYIHNTSSSIHRKSFARLYIVVRLFSGRREVHVDALNVGPDAALEQPLYCAFHRSPLHLVLQVIAQNPVQFLHILCRTTHKTHKQTEFNKLQNPRYSSSKCRSLQKTISELQAGAK